MSIKRGTNFTEVVTNLSAHDHLITQHWLLGLTPPTPNIA